MARTTRGALEVFAIAGLYLASELSRGLASSGEAGAERNAAALVRLERHLHIFGETAVQDAAHRVFGLPAVLGYAYLTLHLAVTASVLVWVYRHRRFAYPRLRNTLALASGLAAVGYALFPTAPPRLANVGITDTVSGATSINLTSRLVSTFYNPYAAVPSVHIGFALIVGFALWRLARSVDGRSLLRGGLRSSALGAASVRSGAPDRWRGADGRTIEKELVVFAENETIGRWRRSSDPPRGCVRECQLWYSTRAGEHRRRLTGFRHPGVTVSTWNDTSGPSLRGRCRGSCL